MKKSLLIFLLISSSIVFSIYLMEILLFLNNPMPWIRGYAIEGYDLRTPEQVTIDKKKNR